MRAKTIRGIDHPLGPAISLVEDEIDLRNEIELLRTELAQVRLDLEYKTAQATAFFEAGAKMRQKALEEAAAACDTEAANPSCLWRESGCWKHAAENCGEVISLLAQAAIVPPAPKPNS